MSANSQDRYWHLRHQLPGFPLTARDRRRLKGSRKARKQERHKKKARTRK